MKRIRINNDFSFAWAIERNGVAENFTGVLNMVLTIKSTYGAEKTITDYDIAGNIITVEVTPEIADKVGRYRFTLSYELPDITLTDSERLCTIDTDAFVIVPRTAEADDSENLLVTSDMAIGFKGDPFTYSDFTPEQIAELKGASAYQIWLSLGNTGTEQDFINSLAAGGIDLSSYLTELEASELYLTAETDPTVPAWAKAASKPTYGVAEITGLQTALDNKVDDSQVLTNVPANAKFTDTVYTHPATHPASIITQDASNRFVTDTEKSTWNAKQEALGFTAENVSNKKTTLTDSDTDYPTTKAVNTALSGKANTTHTHDDRYYTESEVNTLLAAKNGAYNAEKVTSPTTGTLTLKNSTETVLDGALTTSNVFTVALPTPVSGKVNESVLIFKIGATLPTITQPSGIVWRGSTPTLAINTNWTIVYEQINTTGSTYEIWAVATKNA